RALGRHHSRSPPRSGILDALLDRSAEFRRRRRRLFAVDRDRGAGRPWGTSGFLRNGPGQITCSEKKAQRKCCGDFHGSISLREYGFPVVLHIDDGPALRLGGIKRMVEPADGGVPVV